MSRYLRVSLLGGFLGVVIAYFLLHYFGLNRVQPVLDSSSRFTTQSVVDQRRCAIVYQGRRGPAVLSESEAAGRVAYMVGSRDSDISYACDD